MNSTEKPIVQRWVDIVSYNAETEDRRVVAHCVFDGVSVLCEGEPGMLETLQKGIVGSNGITVTLKDGEKFLEAIASEFRSAYLFATEIQEEPIKPMQD